MDASILARAVEAKAKGLRDALLAKVEANLSGDVLRTRSGALKASIVADLSADATSVVASIASVGVPYAAIQEAGVGPVFTYLGKRSDNQIDGFKAGASVDQAIEINRVRAEAETNKIRATLILGSPVFKLVNWIAGPITALYYFCVVADTIQGSFTHDFVGIASLPGAFGEKSWTILLAYLVAQTTQHGIATFADAWRAGRPASR